MDDEGKKVNGKIYGLVDHVVVMTGICPYCEKEVDPLINEKTTVHRKYLLLLCPNCMRILGAMPHDKK